MIALSLLLLPIAAWEGFWRAAGVRASARDPAAYVVARGRIGPTSTVLLGTSKMQSDVDPRVWARVFGRPAPVDLAVAGSSPLPLLEVLATDTAFRGTVVMEILPRIAFASTTGRERAAVALEESYREAQASPAKWIEARLDLLVTSAFVFRRSGLRPKDALRSVRDRRFPRVPDFRMRPDRFLPLTLLPDGAAERTQGDLRRMRTADPPAPPAMRDSIIGRLDRAAMLIERRGGRVVFVVLPGSGAVRAFESELYPRDEFSGVLAARTQVVTIHTDDEPTLNGFDAPDGSHLAGTDTPRFTEALAAVIRDRLRRP